MCIEITMEGPPSFFDFDFCRFVLRTCKLNMKTSWEPCGNYKVGGHGLSESRVCVGTKEFRLTLQRQYAPLNTGELLLSFSRTILIPKIINDNMLELYA